MQENKHTVITYLYRDADNYKQYASTIIKGAMTSAQLQTIMDCMHDGCEFIPSDVGLPDCCRTDSGPWYETDIGFADPTNRPATIDLTVDELVQNFLAARDKWAVADFTTVEDTIRSMTRDQLAAFLTRMTVGPQKHVRPIDEVLNRMDHAIVDAMSGKAPDYAGKEFEAIRTRLGGLAEFTD